MFKYLAIALAVGVAFATPTIAEARDGCGAGLHRGPAGRCRPNVGRGGYVVAPGLVVGRFYAGRGYWNGQRYYERRYRHNNGWRYR